MSDERTTYINYVQNVLGVKSLVLDVNEDTQVLALLVRVENLASYSQAETDLLNKMLSALKLDSNQIKITDTREKNILAKCYLDLVDVPIVSEKPNYIVTYSARTLLLKPEFKKQTWVNLQTIMGLI